MLHRIKTKTLHRDRDHRKALIKNLSDQLITHEAIVTTVAKAKFLRPHFERLVTKAKKGKDFNTVKYLKARLASDEAVRKLVEDLGPRFEKRPGGYTRIIKVGNRDGDNAPMARIELTEKPAKKKEEKPKEKSTKKASKKEEAPKPEEEKKEKKKVSKVKKRK